MAGPRTEIWELEHGQPPQLQSLVGLKVIRAWLLPPGKSMFFRFENNTGLLVERISAVGMGAISFMLTHPKPDPGWDFLEELQQTKFLEILRGTRLVELDGDTLTFRRQDGKIYGAQFQLDRVRNVTEA